MAEGRGKLPEIGGRKLEIRGQRPDFNFAIGKNESKAI